MSASKINIFEIGEQVKINITETNRANVIIKPADVVLTEKYRDEALAFRNQANGFAQQTKEDAIQTALDRVQTGLDRQATEADRIQTGLDRQATEADRIQTGLDRVQTGLDVIATNEAKTDAEAARDEIPILLVNFFDPAIIALNSRIIAEGATVVRKLYIVQIELGQILNEI